MLVYRQGGGKKQMKNTRQIKSLLNNQRKVRNQRGIRRRKNKKNRMNQKILSLKLRQRCNLRLKQLKILKQKREDRCLNHLEWKKS